MKISKIIIENFRSIEYAEISPSCFNVFVGQNNHGKTNLFEAIEWFFQGTSKSTKLKDLKYCREDERKLSITIEFADCQDGIEKMKNDTNRPKIKSLIGESDTATVIRHSDDEKKRFFIIKGELKTSGTGFDAALNDFLPKLEYVNTRQYYNDIAKYSKTTPIGIMLSGVLNAILEKDQDYKDFQEKFIKLFEDDNSKIKLEFDTLGNSVKGYLEKQFPDCTKVKFEVTPPIFDDLLKNFDTSIDDGIETDASEKGDGMQRALMLAIIQAYAKFRREGEEIGKSFLFFIDEAELHLHPTAQRKLKNVLLELSKDTDQVFVNTHSSVLISDYDETQCIFKVEKTNKSTSINEVSDLDKPYIVFELLGGNPSDLLLPCNFMIVEGKSENEFLKRVILRHYSDKPKIHILQARGDLDQADRTIAAIERVFSPLEHSIYRNKMVLLHDRPHTNHQTGYLNFMAAYPYLEAQSQIFELPQGSLEEYYPERNSWRKTSDEVANMRSHQKIRLAREIGDAITLEEFEEHMNVVAQSLERCWAQSFN